MVPFYGQGMNCGFEDVVVFFEILDKHGFDNINRVLDEYSRTRVPDAHSICDLAQRNYEEVSILEKINFKIRSIFNNLNHLDEIFGDHKILQA